MTSTITEQPTRRAAEAASVEIHDGRRWTRVCALADLEPGRGTALLVDGRQVAAFRDRAGGLYALDNRDPFSGAYVLARSLLGTRGEIPVLISPMYKQAFDLRDGTCLDPDEVPDGGSSTLRTWPIRLRD
ncbi:nitrite reductase small subunit NirD [Streptacidiphilus sp. P02-A3a]|uniref:nitrite reductase small subunit NirD n=1 Tax=Streptacidiphilus sp. P02-A3a TaxID=2704468 RepID=UPI0015F7F6EB|nr:nitrite reductase small subunit NirD [Streptacidiphilus sp. P02-A3a]QMU69710.1 nitrite reductase small subunit NirD [Streptacidiphilus sp. P02-A3a]